MQNKEFVVKAEPGMESVWTGRFITAAMVQGMIAFVVLSALLYFAVFGAANQSTARIIAGGSVGTWILVGFFGFLTVGVLGTAVSGLFYHHVEVVRGRRFGGLNRILAWTHLLLLNIGATGASLLMIYAGYIGGSHMLSSKTPPPAIFAEVHGLIAAYTVPIGAFMALGALGMLAGGFGFLRAWFGKGIEAVKREKVPLAA